MNDAVAAAVLRLVEENAGARSSVVRIGAGGERQEGLARRLGFGRAMPQGGGAPLAAGEASLVVADRASALRAALAATAAALPEAVVLAEPAPRRRMLDALDRDLFDRGLVRLAGEAGPLIWRRSGSIGDPHATGGRTGAAIAMSHLGHHAGFANQLFQYAFLKLYGLRHNCAVETPSWIGETVFGVPPRPIARRRREHRGDEWSVADLALWQRERPPVGVDFFGYYQNVPPCWQAHRDFLRRLYRPLPPWRDPVERWLAAVRPPGRTLVAIHVRRGDYRGYDPAVKPWFRLIPEAWYRRWLEALWPTLDDPVLFIASDDRAAVVPAFADFAPLTAAALEPLLPEPRYLADFQILARADILAICNSSFSRMAALLAPDAQRCVIPAVGAQRFEPYDAWAADRFWQRFGAPAQPRKRSLVPRVLRRRPA